MNKSMGGEPSYCLQSHTWWTFSENLAKSEVMTVRSCHGLVYMDITFDLGTFSRSRLVRLKAEVTWVNKCLHRDQDHGHVERSIARKPLLGTPVA